MAQSEYVEAEYGVPHTKFERTDEGFTVSFKKIGEATFKGMRGVTKSKNTSGVGAAIGILVLIIISLIVAAIQMAFMQTEIKVDNDSVIIDGKRLRRADFGSFNVHHTLSLTNSETSFGVLGYQYGNRSFKFGGVWDAREAEEVASALNRHLRITPSAAQENKTSPEALRAARPTDF